MYDDLDLLVDWQDDPWLAAAAIYEAPLGLPGYCCGAQQPPGAPEQPPPYVPPPYQPPVTCPPGYSLVDGLCVPPPPPPTTQPECPPGTQLYNGQCIPYIPPPPPPPPPPPGVDCPPGTTWDADRMQCLPPMQQPDPTCPPGYAKNALGQCVRRAVNLPPTTRPCPPGYSRTSDGRCVIRGFNPPLGNPNRPQIPRPDLPSQCPPGWTYQQANDGSWVCLPTIY